MTFLEAIHKESWADRLDAFRIIWNSLAGAVDPAKMETKLEFLNHNPEALPALINSVDIWLTQTKAENDPTTNELLNTIKNLLVGENSIFRTRFINTYFPLTDPETDETQTDPQKINPYYKLFILSVFAALIRSQFKHNIISDEDISSWINELRADCKNLEITEDSKAELSFVLDSKQKEIEPKEIIQAARDLRDLCQTSAGEYEIFMPIVAESFSDYSKNDAEDTVSRCNPAKFGAMIVAHVTIIKNKALPEFYLNEKVIVAPWTTFVPTGIHFENLQNNLIDGLTKINSQAEEFSLADHAYVIDLRPVLPTDINNDGLGKYDFESKLTATWPLMPSHFGLEGESIGLSIALAAWAALETKSLRPVIATGSFDGEAKIGSVGGIEEKFRVTAFFKNLLNNECIFLLPRGNNDIPAAHASNPKCFHRFSELITSDFLTDGFDELRSRFGVFGKIDEQEFKVLFPYSELEVSDNDSTGFIQSDLDEINEFLNQLQSRFQQIREGGESNPNGMQILTLPFGESPEQVISVLMHEIRTAWRELKPTELNDGPVILPVNLAEVSVDELDSPVSAIQAALQKTYQVAVSEEALLNKREKQKLIFLVFDRKSDQTSCWDESRFEKQKKLYQLFRQWNHEMKVPLFVVCSDYHHECLWRLETA